MKKLITFTLLFMVVILIGAGCAKNESIVISSPTPVLTVAPISTPMPNLVIAAGELKVWECWTINPSKYFYGYVGNETVRTTISNLSEDSLSFDMGDGNTLNIPANSRVDYRYNVYLDGNTTRIVISKIGKNLGGVGFQEAIALKIEPRLYSYFGNETEQKD